MRITPLHLIASGLSSLLGLIAGSSFFWAAPSRAWSLFLAGFLWTLIVATATALMRCVRERLRRGEWRRSLVMGLEMTFPPTTLYLAVVLIILAGLPAETIQHPNGEMVSNKPEFLMVAPIFYSATLVVALVVGPLYALTSPFKQQATLRSRSRQGNDAQ